MPEPRPRSVPALTTLIPMLHVASVPRSIAFYERLGFDVLRDVTPPGQADPSWAWMQSGGASLMLVRASAPVDAEQQAVIFVLYSANVEAFHAALRAEGITVGEIEHAPEGPLGRFRVADPDGYALLIARA
jgi:catechol 2,3-dioxygenase-like lactoylglutathione lyase family enzyme